jgi:two-component system, cell cycle sensor histidine kinase and response regulator CckA
VSPETILVVEAAALVRTVVVAILKKGGFDVLTANSAKHAMLVEVNFPGIIHVLLSDVMMPDMCGPDLANAMKKRRPDMRVVWMSGYADAGLLLLNFGWHLIKTPLLPETLLQRVNHVLRSEFRQPEIDRSDRPENVTPGSSLS